MHWIEEGHRQAGQTAGAEHPCNFGQQRLGITHMLDHLEASHEVDGRITNWQPGGIAKHVRAGAIQT